jgi:hypothetical protein
MSKLKLFFITSTLLLSSQLVLAANIFVRETRGTQLSRSEIAHATNSVKDSIRSMPEHNLVFSESNADYILQPTIQQVGSKQVLRLQTLEGSEVIASTEHPYSSSGSEDQFSLAARSALTQIDAASELAQSSVGHRAKDNASLSGSSSSASSESSSSESDAAGGGEIRGAGMHPGHQSIAGKPIYYTVGLGPAVAVGLNTDHAVYNLLAAFNADINERYGAKILGNFTFGGSGDESRFAEIAVGGNLYFPEANIVGTKPYLTADVGYGSVRRADTQATRDGAAIGAGLGFQIGAKQTNLDLLLHYAFLTATVAGETPSVLGLQLAVNF